MGDHDCTAEIAAKLRDLAAEATTPGTDLNNAVLRGVNRYLAPGGTTADLGRPLADELDARATALLAGGAT